MRKIISLIIVLSIFAMGCNNAVMAFFAVPETNINEMYSSNIELDNDECCETMSGECNNEEHKCCVSPFNDLGLISNFSIKNTDKKIKFKSFGLDFLAILQESFEYNYINKTTSPPNYGNGEIVDNLYTTLTGIIKSNC